MSEGRWRGRAKVVAAIVALGLGATLFAVAGPTQGQGFPGANGLIVYDENDVIFTINPDNPIPQALTQAGLGLDSARFNREANKLIADNDASLVTFAPTPGAAITQVPGTAGGFNPSFNPDTLKTTYDDGTDVYTIDLSGAHIVMENNTNDNISRIDATGGGLINAIVPAAQGCAADDCESPTFDPTSSIVAFDQDGAPQGIFTVLANGLSANATRQTTGNHDDADWAPDGSKLVFEFGNGNIATVPSNGSQLASDLGVAGNEPNWGTKAVVAPTPSPSGSPAPTASPTPVPTPTPTPRTLAALDATRSTRNDTPGKSCVFNVTLTPAAGATPVTVTATTSDADGDRTNKKGVAFVGSSQTLTFASGDGSETVTVGPLKKKKQATEIDLTLTNASGATIGDGQAVCSIPAKNKNR
jgi:hypothetical protein